MESSDNSQQQSQQELKASAKPWTPGAQQDSPQPQPVQGGPDQLQPAQGMQPQQQQQPFQQQPQQQYPPQQYPPQQFAQQQQQQPPQQYQQPTQQYQPQPQYQQQYQQQPQQYQQPPPQQQQQQPWSQQGYQPQQQQFQQQPQPQQMMPQGQQPPVDQQQFQQQQPQMQQQQGGFQQYQPQQQPQYQQPQQQPQQQQPFQQQPQQQYPPQQYQPQQFAQQQQQPPQQQQYQQQQPQQQQPFQQQPQQQPQQQQQQQQQQQYQPQQQQQPWSQQGYQPQQQQQQFQQQQPQMSQQPQQQQQWQPSTQQQQQQPAPPMNQQQPQMNQGMQPQQAPSPAPPQPMGQQQQQMVDPLEQLKKPPMPSAGLQPAESIASPSDTVVPVVHRPLDSGAQRGGYSSQWQKLQTPKNNAGSLNAVGTPNLNPTAMIGNILDDSMSMDNAHEQKVIIKQKNPDGSISQTQTPMHTHDVLKGVQPAPLGASQEHTHTTYYGATPLTAKGKIEVMKPGDNLEDDLIEPVEEAEEEEEVEISASLLVEIDEEIRKLREGGKDSAVLGIVRRIKPEGLRQRVISSIARDENGVLVDNCRTERGNLVESAMLLASPKDRKAMLATICNHAELLSEHRSGSLAVRRVLDECTFDERKLVLDCFKESWIIDMVDHEYGNFVVKYFLDKKKVEKGAEPPPEDLVSKQRVADILLNDMTTSVGRMMEYGQKKCSSHVMQSAIKAAGPEHVMIMCEMMLADEEGVLDVFANNELANYPLQHLLKRCVDLKIDPLLERMTNAVERMFLRFPECKYKVGITRAMTPPAPPAPAGMASPPDAVLPADKIASPIAPIDA